jgi:hypothetical protein
MGEAGGGSGGRRQHLSQQQRDLLECKFAECAYPSSAEKQRIARAAGLASVRTVGNWFQSRRKKPASATTPSSAAPAPPTSSTRLLDLSSAGLDSPAKALSVCENLLVERCATIEFASSLQLDRSHLPNRVLASSSESMRSCVACLAEGSSLPLSQLVPHCTHAIRASGAEPSETAVRNALNMIAKREPLVGKECISDEVDPYEDCSTDLAWRWHVEEDRWFPQELWPSIKELRGRLERCRLRVKQIDSSYEKLKIAAESDDSAADGLLAALMRLSSIEPVVSGFWQPRSEELPQACSRSEKEAARMAQKEAKEASNSIKQASKEKEKQEKDDDRARKQAENEEKQAQQSKQIAKQQVRLRLLCIACNYPCFSQSKCVGSLSHCLPPALHCRTC